MKLRPKSHCLVALVALAAAASLSVEAAPTVVISNPKNGTRISGKISVEVTTSDDSAVKSVTLKVDGAAVAEPLQSPPFRFTLDTTKFQNGLRTLHVAWSDTDGKASRSSITSVSVTNRPEYALSPGPYTIEDLGSPISANTQEKQFLFRCGPSNDLHLLLYYVVNVAPYPIQILDLNLSQKSSRLLDACRGRPGPAGTALHPDGKIYLCTGDPGYFMSYDPQTGETQQIAQLTQKSGYYMEVGDDGYIYIGECCDGVVDRYNPANGVFESLGRMDETSPGYQYAYTLGADKRYLYVGLGQAPWYLAIYDTQLKTKTNFWKDMNDRLGTVYQAKEGGWYYYRLSAAGTISWYHLSQGQAIEVPKANVPPLYEWCERGNVINDAANFPSKCGIEVNLDDAYPDSVLNKAIVRWRSVSEPNWQSITATGFRVYPVTIRRMNVWPGGKLFGAADFYGPVFLYDPATSDTTILGRPQVSLYDELIDSQHAYLSGYAAATLTYDPSKPWTLSASTTNRSNPSVNPHLTGAGFGKYHYYSEFGADGLIYIGVHHERDSTGGELGWYDPLTDTKGSLRDPFTNDDVRDLKGALGGSKLVYSSLTKLFVFDVATKSIERTIVPLSGATTLDKICEVAPGIILGATGNQLFKVDIRDGTVLYSKSLPGLAFGGSATPSHNRRLDRGPDGNVWLFIDDALYCVNPTDGALTKVVDTPAKSLLFNGGNLYLYGGTNLMRVNGVLTRQYLQPATNLRPASPN